MIGAFRPRGEDPPPGIIFATHKAALSYARARDRDFAKKRNVILHDDFNCVLPPRRRVIPPDTNVSVRAQLFTTVAFILVSLSRIKSPLLDQKCVRSHTHTHTHWETIRRLVDGNSIFRRDRNEERAET